MALLEFYGNQCPHCIQMKPVVEQLESELGVTVDKYEVWENEEHAEMMKQYDDGMCGGVPFFINTETKETICGSTDFESLKKWARAK